MWGASEDEERQRIADVIRRIRRNVAVTWDNECWEACAILIFVGIDTMAAIDRPVGKETADRSDFIAWAEKYIVLDGPRQVPGIDLYASRCAHLHTYGSQSKLSREGRARVVMFAIGGQDHVHENPKVPDAFILRLDSFKDAFLNGLAHYFEELGRDPKRAKLVHERFVDVNQLLVPAPIK